MTHYTLGEIHRHRLLLSPATGRPYASRHLIGLLADKIGTATTATPHGDAKTLTQYQIDTHNARVRAAHNLTND